MATIELITQNRKGIPVAINLGRGGERLDEAGLGELITSIKDRANLSTADLRNHLIALATEFNEFVLDLGMSSFEVKFGFKVSTELGFVLVSSSADCEFSFTMKWSGVKGE